MAKLTKRIVDGLSAQDKDLMVWDGDLPGFGIRVKPSGVKSFCVQYRNGQGRSRRMTIGRFGRLTVDEARKGARQILADADRGNDPVSNKASLREAETMKELINLYLDRHARPHKSPRSVKDDLSLINQHVIPRLGRRQVKEITRQDILNLHHDLEDTPIRANRTLALLSKMFSLAEEWGQRPSGSNPCFRVKRYKENKRKRYLSGEEFARLAEALNKGEEKGTESPFTVGAIRMLIFTGMRLGEVLGLKWDYVDFEGARLNLPESKTGAKSLPLTEPALRLLAGMPRLEGNEYVFCGAKPGRPLVNLNKAWRRIRARAGIPDVRMHDLRHSYASIGAAAGLGLPMIGSLLGHTQAATTQRYAHLADDPQRAAAEEIGRRITEAMSQPVEHKVINLNTRGKV